MYSGRSSLRMIRSGWPALRIMKLLISNDEEIRRLKQVKRKGVPEPGDTDYMTVRHCIIEIKELNMTSMTPMDAMNFLHTMQAKLKDINI